MESTVYIFQRPRPRKSDGWVPDLSNAATYGKLEFIFDAEDRPYAAPSEAYSKARERLKDFDPARDYLCWASYSDIMSIVVVVKILTVLHPAKPFRFLCWSKGKSPTGDYDAAGGYYLPCEA